MTNIQPIAGVGVVQHYPAMDMLCYDRLPRPIRDELKDMPILTSAVRTLQFYMENGLEKTIAKIRTAKERASAAYLAELQRGFA